MTDVHFHPAPAVGQNVEATEMAAFEKGRMQGEMEAIRRMEAEQGAVQLKQFPAEPVALAPVPDVVEINRLTWLQKLSAALGESCAIVYLICTIVWLHNYRGNVTWSNSSDQAGDITMWNTGWLLGQLGLFCLSQALLMYRVLPLNMNAWLNRGIYLMWQSFAAVGFTLFLVTLIVTPADSNFWSVDTWCFGLGYAIWGSHFLYSSIRVLLEGARPVDYETWAETNTKVTVRYGLSPEQRRDEYLNAPTRTVYAPAPHFSSLHHTPAANANVGAEVPVAPVNAPRWAENPNTYAGDYFLLPRAKWAIVGFFAIGAACLMILAAAEHDIAAGHFLWAQGQPTQQPLGEISTERSIIDVIGLFTLLSIVFVAYAAMPPRTTLVKNGILAGRRASISTTAETRVGQIV